MEVKRSVQSCEKAGKMVAAGKREGLVTVAKAVAVSSESRIVTVAKNKGFVEQVTRENVIYVVKWGYDLGGAAVTLPKGCTLEFRGGTLSNGTLVGRDSEIVATNRRIFKGVAVKGTWRCIGNALWWAEASRLSAGTMNENDDEGAVWRIQERADCSADLQLALDSAFREMVFPPVAYYIGETLVLRKEKRLTFEGSTMCLSLAECQPNINGAAVVFTDKDITLLRVAVKEGANWNQASVAIDGGNFDVSLCQHYTQNCIEVRTDGGEKVWGLTINTAVKAANPPADNPYVLPAADGTAININPVENKAMAGNKAFVTGVRINALVTNFGTGIRATNYFTDEPGGVYANWCTDIRIDGIIKNCLRAIDTNVEDADIRATIQAGGYFGRQDNGRALIRYTGGFRAAVSSPIYDIGQNLGKWSNQYAVEVTREEATVTAYGCFRSFIKSMERFGKAVIKGRIYD